VKWIAGYVLLTLGLVFIFLSPFLLIYSAPRIEKAPTDSDEAVVSVGQGTYFKPAKLGQVTSPIRDVELLKGQPSRSTHSVTVIFYTSELVNSDDGSAITYDEEVYAMDRHTGAAANCCGERPKMSGETLKFPFGTEKKDYQLWDPSANGSFAVSYVRTEDLDGVEAYVFEGQSDPISIGPLDLPNSLIGVTGQGQTSTTQMYQAKTTVWIEPITGQVLKGAKDLHQWAELNGTKVLDLANLQLHYSDATVAHFADQANKNVKQLKLATTTLPIFGPILGVLLVIAGLILLRPLLQASTSSGEPEAKAA
jgi:hypothetical protein